MPPSLNFTPVAPSYLNGSGLFVGPVGMQASMSVTRSYAPALLHEDFESMLLNVPVGGQHGWAEAADNTPLVNAYVICEGGALLGGLQQATIHAVGPGEQSAVVKALTAPIPSGVGHRCRFSFLTLPGFVAGGLDVYPSQGPLIASNGAWDCEFDWAGNFTVYDAIPGAHVIPGAFVPGAKVKCMVIVDPANVLKMYLDTGAGWTLIYTGTASPLPTAYMQAGNFGTWAGGAPVAGCIDGITIEPYNAVPVTVTTNNLQDGETGNGVSLANVASVSYSATGNGFTTAADTVTFKASVDGVHYANAGPVLAGSATLYDQTLAVATGGLGALWAAVLPDDFDFNGVNVTVLEVMI